MPGIDKHGKMGPGATREDPADRHAIFHQHNPCRSFPDRPWPTSCDRFKCQRPLPAPMCLFSDGDIQKSLQRDELQIEPFTPENLTPNGLDLTIGEVYLKQNDQRIHEGTAVIPPGTWFAVSTREVVTLGPKMAAQLWIRSSYARRGAIAGFGKVEAGFSGQLTIGAANLGDEPLELPLGDRFCQIVFESLHSTPESLYEARSGNYQGQRGVTLAPNQTETRETET